MAFERLDSIVDRVIRRVGIDCAVSAGTDADAEKMAAALDQRQPPSQGGQQQTRRGIGNTGADASSEHTPTAPPISGSKFTDISNAHAPARSVNLVLVIDNKGGRDEPGRSQFVPTVRASRQGGQAARETEKEVPVFFAPYTGKRGPIPNPLDNRQTGLGARTGLVLVHSTASTVRG